VRLSHDILMADAGSTGFRPEILEKCELLLSLLQGLVDDPFLGPRLVLKGGTGKRSTCAKCWDSDMGSGGN
jgi:hypothetical protein